MYNLSAVNFKVSALRDIISLHYYLYLPLAHSTRLHISTDTIQFATARLSGDDTIAPLPLDHSTLTIQHSHISIWGLQLGPCFDTLFVHTGHVCTTTGGYMAGTVLLPGHVAGWGVIR
jgi:hypothetical protein